MDDVPIAICATCHSEECKGECETPEDLFPEVTNEDTTRARLRDRHEVRKTRTKWSVWNSTAFSVLMVVVALLCYAYFGTRVFTQSPEIMREKPAYRMRAVEEYSWSPTMKMERVTDHQMDRKVINGLSLTSIARAMHIHLHEREEYVCMCMHHLAHPLKFSSQVCALWTGDQAYTLINPEMTGHGNETFIYNEHSLVCKSQETRKTRYTKVWIRFRDQDNDPMFVRLDDKASTCLQMMIDELNGEYTCE
jgi:peptide deformylase